MSGTVHVLGAGLSGLAAALTLSNEGREVILHEAAPRAGGRCRSYHDPVLDRVIDNGNHLMMSANSHVFAYLDEIGARDRVYVTSPAAYPFCDVTTGERWTLRPNAGPIPWWIFSKSRRVPGTTALDYLAGWRLMRAGANDTVADCLDSSTLLWQRFWEPLSVAALNIDASRGAAGLLAETCRLTFAKGEALSRPVYVRQNLADALVDPAVAELQRRGAEINYRSRVKGLLLGAGRITGLDMTTGLRALGHNDQLVCALPSWSVSELLPDLDIPTGHTMILNVHYRLESPITGPPVQGLTGSVAQWLFLKDDIAAVTVSAADAFGETEAEQIAALIWPEVAIALGQAGLAQPVSRVVKEKRATFAETPANERLRPGPVTAYDNLFLAGDWTATGLPATIEGAIQSGRAAAQAIL